MLKGLQALAKKGLTGREGAGVLSGKQVSVGQRVVRVDKVLGEGGFATIYGCTDVDTGEAFALKHFLLTGYPGAARDVDTEVSTLEKLQGCPYVVRLHEAAFVGPAGGPPAAAFVLLDFCPDTLVAFLKQRAFRLDEATLLHIFLPVCRAVEAMHSLKPPLSHRDIKAENILLSPGGWVLCDFGSASGRHGVLETERDIALGEEVVRRYTTPAYRAPELYDLYSREFIGPAVDVWSLGVLLYLLAYGRLPFEGEAKLQVLNGRYTLPDGRPEPLRSLIRAMLTVNVRDRPSIQQVIAQVEQMMNGQQQLPGFQPHPQQQGPGHQHAAVDSRLSGGVALHERAPSQGWADFGASSISSPLSPAVASSCSSAAGAGEQRRAGSFGSGSWASFSPTKADAGHTAACAAVAGAGSFWSSFGEEMPSEASGSSGVSTGKQQQGTQPPPSQMHHHDAPKQTAVQAGGAGAANSALLQRYQPSAPVRPPLAVEAAEVSPLSVGLSRMTVGQAQGPGQAASREVPPTNAHPPSSAGSEQLAEDVEALRQHCKVLEQLLETRNDDMRRLQKVIETQAADIKQLKVQAQQGLCGSMPTPVQAVSAALEPAGSGSTSLSSRRSTELQLQVAGSQHASLASSPAGEWVSFNPATGSKDASTPTLLQPADGGTEGSNAQAVSSSSGSPVVAPATAALEGALRAKLDLSGNSLTHRSSSGGLGAGHGSQSMRSSSSGGMTRAAGGVGLQLRSHPAPAIPGASPMGGLGAKSAPVSSSPSPARLGEFGQPGLAGSGAQSPMQPASPMRAPQGGNQPAEPSASPSKHRRNVTAPSTGFFDDLSPFDK